MLQQPSGLGSAASRLFCMHRDLKWHSYELLPESDSLAELVNEVRRGPSGVLWG